MRRTIYVMAILILFFGLAFSGCTENGEDNGNGNGMTGTAVYSGTWSGESNQFGDISGTWEYTVNFDDGTVSGWFTGDGAGDITGSVSDGVISASGEAAFGTVEWSGEFSSDGKEVSGSWEFADGTGSGSWNGSFDREVDENGDDVVTADSLKFTVEGTTAEGDHGILTWSAKDIGTQNMKIRAEGTSGGEDFGVILNGETTTMYEYDNGEWVENPIPPEYWDMMWDSWETMFDGYHSSLSSWTGGEYTYTDGEGNTVKIYDVEIDPNLPDSLFAP